MIPYQIKGSLTPLLQQWEAHGLSHANNAFGDGLNNNADNFDAAGAILGISGMYKCAQIQK
jgi:hypothetical protein